MADRRAIAATAHHMLAPEPWQRSVLEDLFSPTNTELWNRGVAYCREHQRAHGLFPTGNAVSALLPQWKREWPDLAYLPAATAQQTVQLVVDQCVKSHDWRYQWSIDHLGAEPEERDYAAFFRQRQPRSLYFADCVFDQKCIRLTYVL
jgi:hypothetical protein